ncbi:MAG: Glycosyl transferase, group 1 [Clostridia bacterium 41_269]|nr:MAG: Glycosyl transferase, group 1 [Clostridia bacterium 41_269]
MRILMLSWEYPPRSVGGLARHVEDLASAIADTRNEIHIVTCGTEETPEYEIVNGVHVHRFMPYPLSTPDFHTWVLQMNVKMLENVMKLINRDGPFDIVHAHDWLAAFAGAAVKHAYQVPLVATLHATEAGRNHGLHNDQQRYISSVEWWLAYEGWKVIVCSMHMKNEVHGIFSVPLDKITVIPNGVRAEKFISVFVEHGFKNRFAREEEKIIFFVGRLVPEKGVQVLIESAAQILFTYPNAKFVIAGDGPMKNELCGLAKSRGLENKILFTGYVDDETRNKLYKIASVAVFPSFYEPFGIVALEAMAAGTPVVVSDTGGLSEIIIHGQNGLKAYPGNPDSLASNIIRLLTDEIYAEQISKGALRIVREVYDWNAIAEKTIKLYKVILKEHRRTPWGMQRPLDRFWNYALSFISQKEHEQEFKGEIKENEDFQGSYLGRDYDLVNYRIAANNHREGGNL